MISVRTLMRRYYVAMWSSFIKEQNCSVTVHIFMRVQTRLRRLEM